MSHWLTLLARWTVGGVASRSNVVGILAAVCGLAFGCVAGACREKEENMSEDEWIAIRDRADELTAAGRQDEALVAARNAIEVARSNFGPRDTRVVSALNGLAEQLEGRLSDAGDARDELLGVLSEKLTLLLAQPGSHDREVLAARRELVRWQLAFRRFSEANAQLTAIFETLTRLYGESSIELARERTMRALDMVRAGSSALAEPLFLAAIPTLRDLARSAPGQVGKSDARELLQTVLRALASASAATGRSDDAARYSGELDALGP